MKNRLNTVKTCRSRVAAFAIKIADCYNCKVPLPELQHRVLIGSPAWADLGDCELPQDYRLQKELDSVVVQFEL